MMFDIFLCAVYVTLVALVTPPKKNGKENQKAGFNLFFPFLSTLFLPWSGASFLSFAGLGSRWWFAAISAAFIFSGPSAGKAALLKGICLAFTFTTAWALNQFALTAGVPGVLYDLESLSMVLRLASLADSKLLITAALFFTGLVLSFAAAWRSTGSRGSRFSSVTAFSFSAYLVIVFVPFDAAALWGAEPRVAALINPVVLFLFAVLLSRFLLGKFLPKKSR
ncbi:MAG: hypothetical protein FWG71_00125 [Synergistaceae bacterium]|nr:hypothetical protein [Synergistaceae bacterium]